MKEVKYNDYAKEALEELTKGAFLNVRYKDQDNTMTIAWGSIGYMWRKPIFMTMVRYSRHTYKMLDKAGEFTVSIPFNNKYKKELALCGKSSGRDIDKFTDHKIAKLEANKIDAPLIKGCNLHYECKVVYKQTMEPGLVDTGNKKFYKDNDYHVLFYGEIVGTYISED